MGQRHERYVEASWKVDSHADTQRMAEKPAVTAALPAIRFIKTHDNFDAWLKYKITPTGIA